jgi:hypothetical protein
MVYRQRLAGSNTLETFQTRDNAREMARQQRGRCSGMAGGERPRVVNFG